MDKFKAVQNGTLVESLGPDQTEGLLKGRNEVGDAPIVLREPAVCTTGTAWAVSFPKLTDQFLTGFAIQCYIFEQLPLPFFVVEFFLRKDASGGTSTLEIRFQDKSLLKPVEPNSKVTVQLYYPAP